MRNEEATHLAELVAELWGVDRGPNWTAFYAATIADLPTEATLAAIKALFATERFCPTPQQVVATVTGTTDNDAMYALDDMRSALRANAPIDPAARRAAIAVWGTIDGIPLHDRVPAGDLTRFSAEWRRIITGTLTATTPAIDAAIDARSIGK